MPVFHCVPVVVVGLNLCDHCVLSVTTFVYACVTERREEGAEKREREREMAAWFAAKIHSSRT